MILSMQNLNKEYTQGKMAVPVLKDIRLEVEEGEYVAIMGPSGSGKTTLMNILGCLDLPTSGKYIFNNRDITTRTNDQLAVIRNQYIGFVFQNFYLLPNYSAVDNVALPLLYANVPKKERLARAQEALRIVGLEERMKFRPNQLSGGQCQRVAIARAIVSRPQLLLADEPTGALDTASGDQIMEIFEKLNDEGVTIIMITHEPAIAQRAHILYHLRDGELDDPKGLRQSDQEELAAESLAMEADDFSLEPEDSEEYEQPEDSEEYELPEDLEEYELPEDLAEYEQPEATEDPRYDAERTAQGNE